LHCFAGTGRGVHIVWAFPDLGQWSESAGLVVEQTVEAQGYGQVLPVQIRNPVGVIGPLVAEDIEVTQRFAGRANLCCTTVAII